MFSLTEEQKAIKKATLEGRGVGEPVLACMVKFGLLRKC